MGYSAQYRKILRHNKKPSVVFQTEMFFFNIFNIWGLVLYEMGDATSSHRVHLMNRRSLVCQGVRL
jgi:hypothetical protein